MNNLYSPAIEGSLLAQAEADPFGTVTLWTYFNNAINEASGQAKLSSIDDDTIRAAAAYDLVYASLLLHFTLPNPVPQTAKINLIQVLNRCVICNYDIIEGEAREMWDETGISPLQFPSILQVMLAVTMKHHNHDALRKLAQLAGSDYRNIFDIAGSMASGWLRESQHFPKVWSALREGGWMDASDAPDHCQGNVWGFTERANHWCSPDEFKTPGGVLESCIRERPSSALNSYLPFVSRSLYDGISPHPKWPGNPVLVKYASARSGNEGLEVLKILVEIGGMDVNDSTSWWKAGEYDPREWNPKCKDGSDCTETPLHIAVDMGNVPTIEYLLSHGARCISDKYGQHQLDRALKRGRSEIVELFQRHGWTSARHIASSK